MKIPNTVSINKNKTGKVVSVVVNHINSFEEIENLSANFGYSIYVIPDNRKCVFNEDGWLVYVENNNFEGIWEIYNGWSMRYDCLVNGFPFPIKMKEIWYSDNPIEEIDVKELEWNLDYPWWSTDDEIPYNLKPKDFINNQSKYPLHIERTNSADTQYPLTLVQTKQNRCLIYDGVHRYVKQLLRDESKVKVKKFKIDEMKNYIADGYLKRFNEWIKLKYL